MLAVIWTFWIGLFLAIGAILTVIAMVIGYLVKVQNPKYPRKP